jgi:hypothetical protein
MNIRTEIRSCIYLKSKDEQQRIISSNSDLGSSCIYKLKFESGKIYIFILAAKGDRKWK